MPDGFHKPIEVPHDSVRMYKAPTMALEGRLRTAGRESVGPAWRRFSVGMPLRFDFPTGMGCWPAAILGFISCLPAARGEDKPPAPIRPTTGVIKLFNGRDLSGLTTWLKDTRRE